MAIAPDPTPKPYVRDPLLGPTAEDLGLQPGGPNEPKTWEQQLTERQAAYAARLEAQTRGAEELIRFSVVVPNKKKDIAIFNKLKDNTVIKYNPPAIAYASGAAAYSVRSVQNLPFKGSRPAGQDYGSKRNPLWRPDARDDVINAGSQAERMTMKGTLIPDLSFIDDWVPVTEDTAAVVDFDLKSKSTILQKKKGGFLLYGFRFPFNPASLDFQLASTSNVNIGYIMSSPTTAMPTGLSVDGGGSISFQIPLSRVDDMMAITKLNRTENQYSGAQLEKVEIETYSVEDVQRLYGSASSATPEDLKGIAQRGTMYDIEYLLRACLGKPWTTVYRGVTADVGLLFGVPMVLTLGSLDGKYQGGMRYRVRLSGISFSHRSFTPNMVPLYTELNLSFDRIPDALGQVKT